MHPIFRAVFHKYDALNESIEENVTGMRDVKSYVRQEYEKEKFGRAAQDVCRDFTRAEKILAFNGADDEPRRVHGLCRGHPVR